MSAEKEDEEMDHKLICEILNSEMELATGCTEPAAIALCAANARAHLKGEVAELTVLASVNIIKNAMAAGIPGTKYTGIDYAAALGATGGKVERQLQVVDEASEEERRKAIELVQSGKVKMGKKETPEKLYVEVEVKSADAWARVAWISAAGEAGADNGIRYRQKGAEEWTTVPSEQITSTSGGSFTALIKGLTPQTTYEYCAYSNDNTSAVSEMTTESEMQIPNSSFDQWHQDGKVWNPWPADGEKWWDTGNRGSTIIGDSNTAPTDDACEANPSGRGVSMLTNFASVGGIGKLAAGSIYTGDFVKIDGMNGILNFGRPFSARPTKLRGYYKYTPAPINPVSEDDFDVAAFMGKNDTCNIYIILGDWDSQVEIRTRPTNRKLVDLNDPHIIAYGSLQNGSQVAEYTPFEIELEYRSTSRKPTYIICVASSSKYGDYFTGGSGSLLVVDEFSLDYDY